MDLGGDLLMLEGVLRDKERRPASSECRSFRLTRLKDYIRQHTEEIICLTGALRRLPPARRR